MANLLVTVIAVALVAVASIMALYYGGRAFGIYQDEAAAMRMISEGEQIAGSAALYANQEKVVPKGMSDLLEKNYMMETPGDDAGQKWEVRRGYAVLKRPPSRQANRECLVARKKFGFDAEENCATAAMAGCAPSTNEAPSACNSHCMRTCFDPADKTEWNPYFDRNDPCCIDNSADASIADPVFP